MKQVNILSIRYRESASPDQVRAAIESCGGICQKITPQIRMARAVAKPGEDIEDVRQRLSARPEIEIATYAAAMKTLAYHAATNDTHLDLHYHLKRTNVFRAWATTKGDASVKLAVVDTGLVHSAIVAPTGTGDIPLPDWSFRSEDDASVPWDFAEGDCGDYNTDYSHGTTCFSIIKAIAGNSSGVAGIAPDCYGIMVAASMSTYPDVINIYAAEGIIEATDQGARAISCSWGQPVPADANGDPINQIGWDLVNAIQYAIDQGVAVINAAGNASEYYPDKNTYGVAEIIMWPAEIDGVTLVSSAGGPSPHTVDCPYNEPGTSSGPAYGYGIDFAVPAADVFTVLGPGYLAPAYANTGPNYGYGAWWDGLIIANGSPYGGGPSLSHHHSTSFAAPQITGILGLIWSVNPALTRAEALDILKTTGRAGRHAAFSTRYPDAVVPDAGAAVAKAKTTLPANAGNIYPHINVWGSGVTTTVSGGVATTTVNGDASIFVTGYSSDPITEVEIQIGGMTRYKGPPTTFSVTASGGSQQAVTVYARTAGSEASETYSDLTMLEIPIWEEEGTAIVAGGSISIDGIGYPAEILTADGDSCTITGTAASLELGTKVAAASVSFAATGTAATLKTTWELDIGSGTFEVTGTAAALTNPRLLSAWAGQISETGLGITFGSAKKLSIGSGEFTLTGTAATIEKNIKTSYNLIADATAFVETGSSVSLPHAKKVPAWTGNVYETGTAAGLKKKYTMPCASESYAVTGTSAAVLLGTGMHDADSGAIALTGTSASVLCVRTLGCEGASYAYTGTSASAYPSRKVASASGSFVETGTSAGMRCVRKLSAAGTAFTESGTAAVLKRNRTMTASAAAFAVSQGSETLLDYGWGGTGDGLYAAPAGYTVGASTATLVRMVILSSGGYRAPTRSSANRASARPTAYRASA